MHVLILFLFPDDEIRECVFLSLDERFDPHLAQAESLTTLFVAMHDGVSGLVSSIVSTKNIISSTEILT